MTPLTRTALAAFRAAIPDNISNAEARVIHLEALMQLSAVAILLGIPRETVSQACARGRKAALTPLPSSATIAQ